MSVQSEITRIQNAVNSAIAAIENKGVSVSDGAGVADLAALIESIICPDVSKVTAAAGNVLAGKVFVDANGNAVTGTMTNRGAVSTTVEAGGTYTIPAGYHNGSGKVTSEASSGYKIAKGTKTLTANSTSFAVDHGLGVKPAGMFVLYNSASASSPTKCILAAYSGTTRVWAWHYISSSIGPRATSYTTGSTTFTTTTATLKTSTTELYFSASAAYYYVIWG